MLSIPRDLFTYSFSATTTPVAIVSPGDHFVVETHNTSTGRIHRIEDVSEFVRVRDPLKVNPAAGPVFIDGASPGDEQFAPGSTGSASADTGSGNGHPDVFLSDSRRAGAFAPRLRFRLSRKGGAGPCSPQ